MSLIKKLTIAVLIVVAAFGVMVALFRFLVPQGLVVESGDSMLAVGLFVVTAVMFLGVVIAHHVISRDHERAAHRED